MCRLTVLLLIGLAFGRALAGYDAESVSRAAIDDIIGKYYAYDPFLLPSARKGRFETYVHEEKIEPTLRYEEKPSTYRPVEKPYKENVPFESVQATQYEARKSPQLYSSQTHRGSYERARFEESVPYLPQFRDIQPKRRRPSHFTSINKFQHANGKEVKDERPFDSGFLRTEEKQRRFPTGQRDARVPLDTGFLKQEDKQYRYRGSVLQGSLFEDEDYGFVKYNDKESEFYPVFREKPTRTSSRLLEHGAPSSQTRASWPYGSDEFFADRPKNTAGRSVRFSDAASAGSERNSLKNGQDIASKVRLSSCNCTRTISITHV